jgi:hypothetical protein
MRCVVLGEMCWNEICGHHSLEGKNPITRVQDFSVWVFQNSKLLLGITVSWSPRFLVLIYSAKFDLTMDTLGSSGALSIQ